jgi:putative colanic acid biosynthesis acetyltransferase WcaF
MKTDLSSFNNSWYKPGNKMKIIIWYFVNVLFFKNPLAIFSSLKVVILKLFGAKIGKNFVIKPSVNIKYPWFLEIGNNVWIGENVWIDNLAKVSIGNNVCISQGAMLLCGNHNYKKSSFDLLVSDIIVEDGAWICAKAIVGPSYGRSLRISSHSILSVASVANKDLESYCIYQGNPSRKIRNRKIDQ